MGLAVSKTNGTVETSPVYVSSFGVTSICRDAIEFHLIGDQLYAGEEIVSTVPGLPYQQLAANLPKGTINSGFSLAKNGLGWLDANFTSSGATFCLSTSGKVLAVFDSFNQPDNCIHVGLKSTPRKVSHSQVYLFHMPK